MWRTRMFLPTWHFVRCFFHASKKRPKNYLRHILKYLRDNSKYVWDNFFYKRKMFSPVPTGGVDTWQNVMFWKVQFRLWCYCGRSKACVFANRQAQMRQREKISEKRFWFYWDKPIHYHYLCNGMQIFVIRTFVCLMRKCHCGYFHV